MAGWSGSQPQSSRYALHYTDDVPGTFFTDSLIRSFADSNAVCAYLWYNISVRRDLAARPSLSPGSERRSQEKQVLVNQTTGETLASQVTFCDTFWLKFKGLMFRRSLDPDQAYVFVYPRESIAETTIHMSFVFFPIAVLWLDAQKRVVDAVVARPFRPYYAPRQAAAYFVECVPGVLERVNVGDKLTF